MGDWAEVIDAYAVVEPSRPIVVRGLSSAEREQLVTTTLGLDAASTRYVRDFRNRSVRLRAPSLPAKLASYANHAAYVGWIVPTLQRPLEVWRHPDPRNPHSGVRDYYLAGYLGPAGSTSHLLILAVAGDVLINCFRLDNRVNANNERFGDLMHVGYAPPQPPLPMMKGAPFPVAPF